MQSLGDLVSHCLVLSLDLRLLGELCHSLIVPSLLLTTKHWKKEVLVQLNCKQIVIQKSNLLYCDASKCALMGFFPP